jgi:hypothetical protein
MLITNEAHLLLLLFFLPFFGPTSVAQPPKKKRGEPGRCEGNFSLNYDLMTTSFFFSKKCGVTVGVLLEMS